MFPQRSHDLHVIAFVEIRRDGAIRANLKVVQRDGFGFGRPGRTEEKFFQTTSQLVDRHAEQIGRREQFFGRGPVLSITDLQEAAIY